MPDGIFLRLDRVAVEVPVRRPLLCTVCGASVVDLPRLPQLGGRSPAEVHEDRHAQEADRA